jgi:hypothetical protein
MLQPTSSLLYSLLIHTISSHPSSYFLTNFLLGLPLSYSLLARHFLSLTNSGVSYVDLILYKSNPGGRVFQGGRTLAYWDCGFKSRQWHGCLSLRSVACCQVEVSSKGWLLVPRGPTDCGVSSEHDCEVWTMRRLWPTKGCSAVKKYLLWTSKTGSQLYRME